MPKYVDGFVIPVPKKRLKDYRKLAALCGKIYKEFGALEYVECVAHDVRKGKITSFPRSVKLKAGETVLFSWIVYKSRSDRDRIQKKVMSDPRLAKMLNLDDLPFDAMRMFYGVFKTLVIR